MVQAWISSRWFALIVLISTAASGFLWYSGRGPELLPLFIGGLPLILIYVGNRRLAFPALYTGLLAVFLLSASISVWAAYDPTAAIHKFWVLLGAILIFYALAAQPIVNLRSVFWGLSLLGLAIAVYFVLTYDPGQHPADLASINQIMLTWAALRPAINWNSPESNFVGGILAVLIIFTLALGIAAWRSRRITETLLAGLIFAVQASILWLTSSRSAWASLGAGLAVWLWWEISKSLSFRMKLSRSLIFRRGLLIAAGVGLVLVIVFPSQLFALAKSLPGAASANTRAGLFINAVKLVPDFWLTGGGLQSFAGLYSQYILGIPFLYFKYGYNLYLDIAIEQGLFGLGALLCVYLVAGASLLNGFKRLGKGSSTLRRFYPAVFAAFLVLLINGAFDDPFYGETATPLLFIVPGLALLLTSALPQVVITNQPVRKSRRKARLRTYALSSLVVLLVGAFLVGFHPLAAAAEANLGAVKMARVELADFPAENWQDGSQVNQLQPALDQFRQALWYNPANRTANYRIGSIAMLTRDYAAAVYYLETAHQIDTSHRGIRKSLGYSYVWMGEFSKAFTLVTILPEAEREMESYVGWWGEQGRPDLAEKASSFAVLLHKQEIP